MEISWLNFADLDSPPSDIQKLIADFYDSLSPQLEKIKEKTFAAEVFGDKTCGYYLLMDIELLLIYLIMLNRAIELARAEAPCTLLTNEMKKEIIEAWDLECIRKTFLCKGAKIDKAIKLDILPAFRKFDVATLTGDTGIGYMHIEGPETEGCEDKETFFIS